MNNDLNYINNHINYCSNCGKSGHIYKNCKNPIISYGIMLFKYYNNNLFEVCRRLLRNMAAIVGWPVGVI